MTALRREIGRAVFLAVAVMVPILLAGALVVAEWTGYGARAQELTVRRGVDRTVAFVAAIPRPPAPEVTFRGLVPAPSGARKGKGDRSKVGDMTPPAEGDRGLPEAGAETPGPEVPRSRNPGGPEKPVRRAPRTWECPSAWRGTWLWESCRERAAANER